jgi:protein-S-isoprenylcysteine O-methyltransferase Ste14
MHSMDPRLPGVVILASSAVFVILKRWTTGSFLKGKPERGFTLWFMHVFNLFFLTAVTPAVAILMVARKWETLDPTRVDPGQIPVHLGLETSGLLLCLAGNALMGWALVTMRGHFQVMGKLPRPTDRLLLSGPYQLVRHPMYASVLGQSLGLALLTQSLAIFTLFCVYLKLILSLVALEEEGLRRAYGENFAAYQSRVKKLVPLFY